MTTHTHTTNAALSSQAAQVLRTLALDEELKWRIPGDPVLGPLARKVARRYVAGETPADALDRAQQILAAGHRVNVEYMGESCRDPQRAVEETDTFLAAARLLPPECSISLDLSHIGLAVDALGGFATPGISRSQPAARTAEGGS